MKFNTIEVLGNELSIAERELKKNGLSDMGFGIQIEISLNTFKTLSYSSIVSHFKPNEGLGSGTVYGFPYIITTDTDRILVAKEM